jgi:hypothetical protein
MSATPPPIIAGLRYKSFGLRPEESVFFTEAPTHLLLNENVSPENIATLQKTLQALGIQSSFVEVAESIQVETEQVKVRRFFGVFGPMDTKTVAKRHEDGSPVVTVSATKKKALSIKLPQGLSTEQLIAALEKEGYAEKAVREDFETLAAKEAARYAGTQGAARKQYEFNTDLVAVGLYVGGDVMHTVGVGGTTSIKTHHKDLGDNKGGGDIMFGVLAGVASVGFLDQALQSARYTPTEHYSLGMIGRLLEEDSAFGKALGLPTPDVKNLAQTLREGWNKYSGSTAQIINASSGLGLLKSGVDQKNPLTMLQGALVLGSWSTVSLLPPIKDQVAAITEGAFASAKKTTGERGIFRRALDGIEKAVNTVLKDPRQIIKLNLFHNIIGIGQALYESIRSPLEINKIRKEFDPAKDADFLGVSVVQNPNGGWMVQRAGDWRDAGYENNKNLLRALHDGFIAVEKNGNWRPLTEAERAAQLQQGMRPGATVMADGTQILPVPSLLNPHKLHAFTHAVAEKQLYQRLVPAGFMRSAGYATYLGANYAYSEADAMRVSAIDLYEVASVGARLLLAEQLRRDANPVLRDSGESRVEMAALFDVVARDIQKNYRFTPLTEVEARAHLTAALQTLQSFQGTSLLADNRLGELSRQVEKLTKNAADTQLAKKSSADFSFHKPVERILEAVQLYNANKAAGSPQIASA